MTARRKHRDDNSARRQSREERVSELEGTFVAPAAASARVLRRGKKGKHTVVEGFGERW